MWVQGFFVLRATKKVLSVNKVWNKSSMFISIGKWQI